MTRAIILSVLFIWTAANAMSELPRLNVEELAEYMEMGAERLKTLRVTAHITQSALTRENGKHKAIEGEFVQRSQFYRMKHDDRFHYSRYGDGREVAYNGEFTTRSNGHGAGIISSVSNAGWNPGLGTLYDSNIQDKHYDYFTPPSMWRVSYLDDVMFEGEPCYVLMVTVRDGEPENGEYEVPWSNEYTGTFYKMVVCPRFGFGFCVVEHILGRMEKGKIVKTVYTQKFSGFHEVAPNVWFPRHSQGWSNNLGDLMHDYSDISVNEPIDDREFVVQFKPGTWVEDRRTGQFYDIPYDDQAAKDLIKSLVGEIKNETEENRPKGTSRDFDRRALDKGQVAVDGEVAPPREHHDTAEKDIDTKASEFHWRAIGMAIFTCGVVISLVCWRKRKKRFLSVFLLFALLSSDCWSTSFEEYLPTPENRKNSSAAKCALYSCLTVSEYLGLNVDVSELRRLLMIAENRVPQNSEKGNSLESIISTLKRTGAFPMGAKNVPGELLLDVVKSPDVCAIAYVKRGQAGHFLVCLSGQRGILKAIDFPHRDNIDMQLTGWRHFEESGGICVIVTKKYRLLERLRDEHRELRGIRLPAKPKLAISSTAVEVSMHDHVNDGGKIEKTVSLKNVGKGILVLTKARAGCSGCIKVELTKTVFEEGETGELRCLIDPAKWGSGLRKRSVYFTSNDSEEEIVKIEFKGTLHERADLAEAGMSLYPSSLFLGKTTQSNRFADRRITIKILSGDTITVDTVDVKSNIEGLLLFAEQGQAPAKITITPDFSNVPVGMIEGQIQIRLQAKDGNEAQLLTVPVAGQILPAILLEPTKLFLWPDKNALKGKVTVSSPEREPIVVSDVEINFNGGKASWALENNGESQCSIVLQVERAERPAGDGRGAIRFNVVAGNTTPTPYNVPFYAVF